MVTNAIYLKNSE